MIRNAMLYCSLLLITALTTATEAAEFIPLGYLPRGLNGDYFRHFVTGLSGDGLTAVGIDDPYDAGIKGYRWTEEMGLVDLGDHPKGQDDVWAWSVSDDGSVVVGGFDNLGDDDFFGGTEAFRWTAETGIVGLGYLPGHFSSSAWSTSADGSVIVGYSEESRGSNEAFRWTAETGMVSLGTIPGSNETTARGVSPDGSIIVGNITYPDDPSNRYEVFRWTEQTGMVSLGHPPNTTGALTRGISGDGSTIAITSTSSYTWSIDSGWSKMDLPEGVSHSRPEGISHDGSTIVGRAWEEFSNSRAVIWNETEVNFVEDVLISQGVDMSGWSLVAARAVSGDGFTIGGWGTNPDGFNESWIARLDPPVPFVLSGGGETYFEDFDFLGTDNKLPKGWSGDTGNGFTRSINSLGLVDGPLDGVDGSVAGLLNLGGNGDGNNFEGSAGYVATWRRDHVRDGVLNEADMIKDAAEDRAFGVGRVEENDPGTLQFEIEIGDAPLHAFTLDWDLEVWGGDPEAKFRGSDGGGFAAELTIGGQTYYEATVTHKPGELFHAQFDGADTNRNTTLIDGNLHSIRGNTSGIVEVNTTDGDVGNTINLTFDANFGSNDKGWMSAVDNVRLRALAPGDADANGTVDVQDLLTLLGGQKFNQGIDGVTWAQGDFNADDQFNTGDLLAMLAYLSGQFPSDPYASEAGSTTDEMADVIVNSVTGAVTVDLAGHTASAILIESASEIFNGQQPDWDTTSQFPSTLPGELGNVLFTSTASGVDKLGVVISSEFLGRDKEFYLDDLDLNILIASEGGALTKGNVIVVPEPSTWLLLLTGTLLVGWRQGATRRSPGKNCEPSTSGWSGRLRLDGAAARCFTIDSISNHNVAPLIRFQSPSLGKIDAARKSILSLRDPANNLAGPPVSENVFRRSFRWKSIIIGNN